MPARSAAQGNGRFPAQKINSQRRKTEDLAAEDPGLGIERPLQPDAPESGEHDVVFVNDLEDSAHLLVSFLRDGRILGDWNGGVLVSHDVDDGNARLGEGFEVVDLFSPWRSRRFP